MDKCQSLDVTLSPYCIAYRECHETRMIPHISRLSTIMVPYAPNLSSSCKVLP